MIDTRQNVTLPSTASRAQVLHHGGQHRIPQGVSTFDDETDAERIERLRRACAERGEPFDEAKVRACYRMRGEAETLEEFNAALQMEANRQFGTSE